MAKGTTLEHTETERSSGAAQRDGIHLSLQGKGGVGKSLVASILAQYFRGRGRSIQCIDTDPVNRTFAQYSGIDATRLELMRDGSIDVRGFDGLMERLLTEDGTFVIDNGASTFIPLWSYIVENQVIDILRQAGKRLYVHTVITGTLQMLQHECGGRSIHPPRHQRGTEVLLASLSVLDRVCAIHGRSPENLRSRALWRSRF